MSGWQKIETAPKDFDTIIDLWAMGMRYADCTWKKPTYGKEPCWVQIDAGYDCDGPIDEPVNSPTHWMLPPEPPK